MPALFAITLFVSAFLLFSVQPMIAKSILPLLGGAPATWNSCMVFFQSALLAGYAYSHLTTSWLGVRRQAAVHGTFLIAPLFALPIRFSPQLLESLPKDTTPIPWLFKLLLASIGLPFIVLATTGPLLQRWYVETGHPEGCDPYYLYGASNFGSLAALLGYVILIEPNLPLANQKWVWSISYGAFAILTGACAIALWRTSSKAKEPVQPPRLATRSRFRWLVLAFVPSSLMLGVTTYLSTDIAPIPLLWVAPLALYLLSFMLAFSRKPLLPRFALSRLLAIGVLLVAILLVLSDMQPPIWILVPLHLLTFLLAALVCHGELAHDRPPVASLTEFYFWIALGGVLGGVFNALLAPLLFTGVREYPLALVLAALLRPGGNQEISPAKIETPKTPRKPFVREPPRRFALSSPGSQQRLDWMLPAMVGVLTAGLILYLQYFPIESIQLRIGLMVGLPAVICYTFVERPVRFGLGVGAMLLAGGLYTGLQGRTLYADRSFFGVLRVTRDSTGRYNQLVHGNTVHGRQSLNPAQRDEPLGYFHRSGPFGQIFRTFGERPTSSTAVTKIAIIGLGAGTMTCYADPTEDWTYYEIDPAVERIALNESFFSYLKDCRPRTLRIVTGDARLRFHEAQDHGYGLVVVDAFSSDAIPVHLLTREALALYLDKLADHGLLAFHISNRYLDFQPVIARLAQAARLVGRDRQDLDLSVEEKEGGKDPSEWIVVARRSGDLGPLTGDPRWKPLNASKDTSLWTDDFSNTLSVLKWE